MPLYTDGIIIRCPDCGTLGVLLSGYNLSVIYKCRNCEGSIMPNDCIVSFKVGRG